AAHDTPHGRVAQLPHIVRSDDFPDPLVDANVARMPQLRRPLERRAPTRSRPTKGLRQPRREALWQRYRRRSAAVACLTVMHVRNISEDARGHWATYVRAVRESLGLNKSAFAAKVGKDRGTI